MKILLVNKYFYRKGGAETYFFALTRTTSQAIGASISYLKKTTSVKFPHSNRQRKRQR